MSRERSLSLPKAVAAAGGIAAWNHSRPELSLLLKHLNHMCSASTVAEAISEVKAIMLLGHQLWAYAYMRRLYNKSPDLYFATILAQPVKADAASGATHQPHGQKR